MGEHLGWQQTSGLNGARGSNKREGTTWETSRPT